MTKSLAVIVFFLFKKNDLHPSSSSSSACKKFSFTARSQRRAVDRFVAVPWSPTVARWAESPAAPLEAAEAAGGGPASCTCSRRRRLPWRGAGSWEIHCRQADLSRSLKIRAFCIVCSKWRICHCLVLRDDGPFGDERAKVNGLKCGLERETSGGVACRSHRWKSNKRWRSENVAKMFFTDS